MAENIPALLTDDWAVWVVDKLASDGETALSDADIAAIIGNVGSESRAVLNQLITASQTATVEQAAAYTRVLVNAFETSIGRSIANGDVQAVSFAKTYTDAEVAKTLAAAKAYTDAHSGTGGVSQGYVDAQDSAQLASAKTYADTKAGEALTGAQSYTDGKAVSTLAAAKDYTDAKPSGGAPVEYVDAVAVDTLATADARISARAESTLSAANEYADGLDRVTASQLSDAVANAGINAEAYTDNAVSNVVSTANEYTDAAIELSTGGLLTSVDAKLADQLEQVNAGDAATLTSAKAYADEVASGGGSGGTGDVTKAYVDNADTSTLTAAQQYAVAQDDAKLVQAKNYTDNVAGAKYTLPGTGVARATLATDVRTSLGKADTALQPTTLAWVDVAAAGDWAASSSVQYLIDGKVVQLGSLLQKSSTLAAGTTENGALVLPVGARPTRVVSFAVTSGGSATGRVAIQTNGRVDVTILGAASSYVRLDGVSFYTV
ncbi:hypothetical protein QEJ61_gp16 [Curtobacterium phage Pize]|uniref:hypothetical protein n=1 Tax=Curtobacterium phage Pize TaxID=2851068 RepID=UPI002202AA49|nr:hypothetical protein QEJ61_gp16 [Curtobacterium phage Pize]QXG07748.1 hypothetical protein [Curtobacterium phage Pize]